MTRIDQIAQAVADHPGCTIGCYQRKLGLTYDYTAQLLGQARYKGLIYRYREADDRRHQFYYPAR